MDSGRRRRRDVPGPHRTLAGRRRARGRGIQWRGRQGQRARVAPRDQTHAIGRAPSPSHCRGHDRLGAEHPLQADEGAAGPLGRGAVAAPEAELAAVIGMDLVGHEAQERDAGRDGAGSGQPAVELPAHPLGEHGRGEGAVVAPQAGEVLAVLGLGFDAHPRAGQAAPGQACVQRVGQGLGREGGDVDPLGGRVELGAHLQVGRGQASGHRSLVEPRGQTVGAQAVGPEATHDRGDG